MGSIHITVKFSLLLLNLHLMKKNSICSICGQIRLHIKMSELLLQLVEDATVRKSITRDGPLYSVFDVMDLACPNQCVSWKRVIWQRLKSDSRYKQELEGLVHMIKMKSTGRTSPYRTPMMTVMGLGKLMLILSKNVNVEFHTAVSDLFQRNLSGYVSIVDEIAPNSASSASSDVVLREREQALQFIIEQQKQELNSLKNDLKCKTNEIATLNRILNEERMLRRSIVRP
jgi:hypothetical protein